MSIFGRIFSHSVLYAVAPQLPKVIGLFLLPVLTPFLSPVDFGVWGTVVAYNLFFSSARDLGMVAPMVNVFYKNPLRWKIVWRQIFFYLLLWGTLFTLLQVIIISFIVPIEAHNNLSKLLIIIGLQSFLFDTSNIIGLRLYQLKEQPIPISIISFISGCITITVQYYSIAIYRTGYMGWFYASFLSGFFSFLAYTVLLYKNRLWPLFVFRYRYFKPRLALALPMIPHNYSAYLLNASDRVIMSLFNINTQQVGLYNVAYMWGNYMEILGNSVGMAVGPTYLKLFSEKTEDSEEKVKILTFFLQVLFLSGSFIVSLWSKELFNLFIKNYSLQSAYPVAIIIIMSYCYRPMYWAVINKLQYFEHTTQLWKISFLGGIVNVALNIIFIPIFGYKAAAVTTFVALLYIGFSGYFLHAFKSLNKADYHIYPWLFVIILSCTLAYLLRDIGWFYKSLLTLFSSIFATFFCYKLSKKI